VLALLASGLTQKEVAKKLGIGKRTIKEHMTHLYPRLGVQSQSQAIAAAIVLGLIAPKPDAPIPNGFEVTEGET